MWFLLNPIYFITQFHINIQCMNLKPKKYTLLAQFIWLNGIVAKNFVFRHVFLCVANALESIFQKNLFFKF